MAHEWFRPAVMARYCPAGASSFLSSSFLSVFFSPQHSTVPLVRIPQVCRPPAAMALYRRLGGASSCPKVLSPQQATIPSAALSAHVCESPAVTALNSSVMVKSVHFDSTITLWSGPAIMPSATIRAISCSRTKALKANKTVEPTPFRRAPIAGTLTHLLYMLRTALWRPCTSRVLLTPAAMGSAHLTTLSTTLPVLKTEPTPKASSISSRACSRMALGSTS